MKGIWVRLIKRQKIWKQDTAPCEFADAKEAMREILQNLDEPYPIWLEKHEREFDEFRMTVFTADHFMEHTDFDRLELQFIDSDAKRQSRDPRNE